MLLVFFLYNCVGVDEDNHISSHAFSMNFWLVNEEVAPCCANMGVASDEAGKR